MDSKMFKVERNTAIPGGIDGLLASFSSIVVFSVTVRFAIQGSIKKILLLLTYGLKKFLLASNIASHYSFILKNDFV